MDSDSQKIAPQEEPTDGFKELTIQIPFPEAFVYSNCASFALSHMDIRIGFAEAMPDGHAVPKVGIVMPPEQAAAMALMLLSNLHVFEERFGEIRNPQWQAAKKRVVTPTPPDNPVVG